MATITVRLCLLGVIETSCSMACNAAEQVSVVVILSTNPFFVFGQVVWKVDFVASATKLGGLMHRLEHLAFMKGWLGLHKQHVDLLEKTVLAVGERVVLWFLDHIVAIASVGLDFGDRMTDRTSDACLARRIVHVVVVRIIEGTTEEWYGVVTTGAEASGVDIPVAFERYFSSFTNRSKIRGIVE